MICLLKSYHQRIWKNTKIQNSLTKNITSTSHILMQKLMKVARVEILTSQHRQNSISIKEGKAIEVMMRKTLVTSVQFK